jgi:UDP-GlcNAc:undecaprenyl-phosphate GlcNAc-1-phosphate transferase
VSWGIFGAALAAGAVCTWLVRAFALRAGIVNRPTGLVPQHTRPVAYLGGVGVAAGLACALALVQLRAPAWPWLVGGALFTAIGLVDDLRPFSPRGKLLLQVAGAVVAVAWGLPHPVAGIAGWLLAVLWIVLLVNAVNVTDVCDGLVGGLAVVAFVALGLWDDSIRLPALAAAGATAGFLVFNRPNASIFLGDAGSHLLGFTWAAFTLEAARGLPLWPAAPQMLLLAGVPLFETAFLIAQRRKKGLAWWRGSPDHFSLRLQAAGLGKLGTDLIAWTAAALLALAAFALDGPAPRASLVLALAVAGLAAAWRMLLRWEVPPRAAQPREPRPLVSGELMR